MVAPQSIPVEEAGPELSRLIESAQRGREVVITRGGQPVARIVPVPAVRPKAGFGKGTVVHMADDFDEPLPEFDEEL